ncbi:MAG: response regulator [Thainema sp.]
MNHAEQSQPSASCQPESQTAPSGTEDRRIAIVCSAIAHDIRLLSNYLRRSGYQVELFHATSNLIQVVKAFRPHAILFDLEEPRVQGYECLQRLHEELGWQRPPLIVLSSLAFQADLQQAIDLGANRYLIKPIEAPLLLTILKEETEIGSHLLH